MSKNSPSLLNDIERRKFLKAQKPIQRIFYKNIDSTADAIVQVMTICNIPQYKILNMKPIIVKTLTNFEMVSYRIDRLPKKLISKKNFVSKLTDHTNLSLKEILLSYAITLRAFNAFYFATTECGLCSKEIEARYSHSRECFWVHAAKRTAQIFAEYEGIFHNEQKLCEERIKCVYKRLNDLIKNRCRMCSKAMVIKKSLETNLSSKKSLIFRDELLSSMESLEAENTESGTKRCNCPKLECNMSSTDVLGISTWEGSQEPFVCHWIPFTDEEPFEEICRAKYERHGPCDESSNEMTESEFESADGEYDEMICEDIFEEDFIETDYLSHESTIPGISSDFSCPVTRCHAEIEVKEGTQLDDGVGDVSALKDTEDKIEKTVTDDNKTGKKDQTDTKTEEQKRNDDISHKGKHKVKGKFGVKILRKSGLAEQDKLLNVLEKAMSEKSLNKELDDDKGGQDGAPRKALRKHGKGKGKGGKKTGPMGPSTKCFKKIVCKIPCKTSEEVCLAKLAKDERRVYVFESDFDGMSFS